MMNLYTKKRSSKNQENDFVSSSSSYSYSKESDKVLDPEFSSIVDDDSDSESESESSKNINKLNCRRRSKRVRKSRVSDLFDRENNEQLSSISYTTPEEDIAHCLMMLSKDKWNREEDDDDKEKKFEDDISVYSEDSDVLKVVKSNNKVRGKYKCETCNKLFKSYQALGGHRASHKRIAVESRRVGNSGGGGGSKAVAVVTNEEKVHECPFCYRVFSSGQALGGHKRSHFVGAGAISRNGNNIVHVEEKTRIGESLSIDLNLPAPIDV